MSRFFVPLVLSLFFVSSSAMCADYTSTLSEARSLAKAGRLQQAIELCGSIVQSRLVGVAEPEVRLFMGHLLISAGGRDEEAMA